MMPTPGLDLELLAFTCPHCDSELRLPAAYAGRRGTCPECEQVIRIPALEDEGGGDESATGPLPANPHALVPRPRSAPPQQKRARRKKKPRPEPEPEPSPSLWESMEQLPTLPPAPWPRSAIAAVVLLATLTVAALAGGAGLTLGVLHF